ncbi:hypothetical protein H4217_005942 [Coemansia sp. RSA 1939]|nr:hypothetical protein H4217_005942 [Coemansia sp. RSA 1939]
MSLFRVIQFSGKTIAGGRGLRTTSLPLSFQSLLNSHTANIGRPQQQRFYINAISFTPMQLNNIKGNARITTGILCLRLARNFHTCRVSQGLPKPVINRTPRDISQVDDRIKHPMYDMPLLVQIKWIRRFFAVNILCAAMLATWVYHEDMYTLLVASAICLGGFIPMACVQIMYHNHVRTIRIIGKLSTKQLSIMRNPSKFGDPHLEYPVLRETPLEIQKYNFFATDPVYKVFVRDLKPGKIRKFSLAWICDTPKGPQVMRISTKIPIYHSDVKLMDSIIRNKITLTKIVKRNKPPKNKIDS